MTLKHPSCRQRQNEFLPLHSTLGSEAKTVEAFVPTIMLQVGRPKHNCVCLTDSESNMATYNRPRSPQGLHFTIKVCSHAARQDNTIASYLCRTHHIALPSQGTQTHLGKLLGSLPFGSDPIMVLIEIRDASFCPRTAGLVSLAWRMSVGTCRSDNFAYSVATLMLSHQVRQMPVARHVLFSCVCCPLYLVCLLSEGYGGVHCPCLYVSGRCFLCVWSMFPTCLVDVSYVSGRCSPPA